MPQITLAPLDQPQKIWSGTPKCPRTLVIQFVFQPGGANVYITSDQQALQNAFNFAISGTLNGLSAGVGLIDTFGLNDQFVLQDVKYDIWARATAFNNNTQGPAIIAVEPF
jgi:hypothetical protein